MGTAWDGPGGSARALAGGPPGPPPRRPRGGGSAKRGVGGGHRPRSAARRCPPLAALRKLPRRPGLCPGELGPAASLWWALEWGGRGQGQPDVCGQSGLQRGPGHKESARGGRGGGEHPQSPRPTAPVGCPVDRVFLVEMRRAGAKDARSPRCSEEGGGAKTSSLFPGLSPPLRSRLSSPEVRTALARWAPGARCLPLLS